jgi:hypothetical protein
MGAPLEDPLRNYIRRPISTPQQFIRFVVADDLFSFRIKVERPPLPVRGVRQVDQSAGDVAFLNGRIQLFLLPAAHAVDKVLPVISFPGAAGTALLLLSQPGAVGREFLVRHRHVALRPVEDIPDGTGDSHSPRARRISWGGTQESRNGDSESERANACLLVGNPVGHFKFQNLELALWLIEFERGVQSIGSLLVVIKHEVSTHG